MSKLAAAGIYVLIQLNGRKKNVNVYQGKRYAGWDYAAFEEFGDIVDRFREYENTLGFFYGNSVVISTRLFVLGKSGIVAMKEHQRNSPGRRVPIGWLNQVFDSTIADGFGDYIACGDPNKAADFLVFGHYMENVSYCIDQANMLAKNITEEYSKYSIPSVVVFGCARGKGHDYAEVKTLFSGRAAMVFSGGIVRAWFDDASTEAAMGLVDVTTTHDNLTVRPEYKALSNQFALLPPPDTPPLQAYTPTNTRPPTCTTVVVTMTSPTASTTTKYVFTLAPQIPMVPSRRLCSCMTDTLSCVAPTSWNATRLFETIIKKCPSQQNWTDSKCHGVNLQAEEGKLGSYYGCNDREQASWLLDRTATENGSCERIGGDVKVAAKPENGKQNGCSILLDQVGPDAVGSVSYFPPMPTSRIPQGRSGPSSGMKAGIGVAVTSFVVLICLAFGAFCIWSRRRRRSAEKIVDLGAEMDGSIQGKHSSMQKEIETFHRYEAEDTEKKEIDGTEVLHELDINDKVELPTNEAVGAEAEDTGTYIHEMDGEPVEERRLREKLERERIWNGHE
ncbi:hypothetical protein EJ08DRAFT_665008 [Tothia fuscella]|uniref:1,3-beta-glucanosyltransferase n=1 Tax=Tothia fuscella TaxID=1048955 RepID=A0A9P4TTW5_9PEZI|nr:hypothetical protein EJ08DRAFT_665008 [Tothia fuscella]